MLHLALQRRWSCTRVLQCASAHVVGVLFEPRERVESDVIGIVFLRPRNYESVSLDLGVLDGACRQGVQRRGRRLVTGGVPAFVALAGVSQPHSVVRVLPGSVKLEGEGLLVRGYVHGGNFGSD